MAGGFVGYDLRDTAVRASEVHFAVLNGDALASKAVAHPRDINCYLYVTLQKAGNS